MASASADDIADLTQTLYEAVFDDRLWPAGVALLKQVLNVSEVALGAVSQKSRAFTMIYGDCDPHYADLAMSGTFPNPFIPALVRATPGTVIADGQLMAREEFERSVFYNDWMVPQDGHGLFTIKTMHGPHYTGFASIMRGGHLPRLDDEDLALARRISPMLYRICDMRMRIGALRLREEASAYGQLDIGVAVVDAQGRVLDFNAAADAILTAPQSPLRLMGGALDAGNRTTMLRAIIASTLDGTSGKGLGNSINVEGLAVTAAPMRDGGLFGLSVGRAAMVFIQRLDADVDPRLEPTLRELFGLTTREAQVAVALASGQSMAEISGTLGISVITVRTHLSQLFAKTRTRQQSQLVSLLRGVLPLGL